MIANERLTLEQVERLVKIWEHAPNAEQSETSAKFYLIYTQLADLMRENERLRTLVGDKLPQDLWSDERCEAEASRQKQEERITKMMNTNPAKDE